MLLRSVFRLRSEKEHMVSYAQRLEAQLRRMQVHAMLNICLETPHA